MQRYRFWYLSRIFLIFLVTSKHCNSHEERWVQYQHSSQNKQETYTWGGYTHASLAISSSITQTEPAAHRVGMPAKGKLMSHTRDEYSLDPKRQPSTVTMICAEGVRTSIVYAPPRAVPRPLLQSTSGLAATLPRVKIPFLVCTERQTFRTCPFLVLCISLTEVEELRQPHTGMTQSGH